MSRALPRRALAASLAAVAAFLSPSLLADVPRVAVDVPPVHSLVARVMGDLGQPAFVMRPGTSPHGYAMRPSEAGALERSEVIFWVGEALTPWLGREIDALAPDAISVELMALETTRRLDTRDGATFAAHGHEETHGHAETHGHDEAHDHEEAHADGHGGAYDPHGWLDPANARAWLDAIAATLAALDPPNAARYAANAAAGQAGIDDLIARTAERLMPLRERPFVVFHDSFHYFEERFGVRAAGALSPNDASDPSPARVQAVRETIGGLDVGCVFAEPQFDPALIRSLVDGLDVVVGTLDPLGAAVAPGATLYERLVDDIAESMLDCLAS